MRSSPWSTASHHQALSWAWSGRSRRGFCGEEGYCTAYCDPHEPRCGGLGMVCVAREGGDPHICSYGSEQEAGGCAIAAVRSESRRSPAVVALLLLGMLALLAGRGRSRARVL